VSGEIHKEDYMKLATNQKLTVTIILSFFAVSLIPFLINPLTENITYVEMIKEDFLWIVYLGPAYALIESIFYSGMNFIIIMILFLGIILPIVFLYKSKRIFPWIIISMLFYCFYLFIGFIGFGIRNGEH
jgi:hypothetical protein